MVKNYDFVVTSGGIGPTHDGTQECIILHHSKTLKRYPDITYPALAMAFNLPLVLNEPTLERMHEMSKDRPDVQKQTPEQKTARQRMALLPEGTGAETLFVCEDLWVVSASYCIPHTTTNNQVSLSCASKANSVYFREYHRFSENSWTTLCHTFLCHSRATAPIGNWY